MSKYGDFLRSQGASDADIALLDTPVAQKAFDALQADADAKILDYKKKADDWFETVAQPNLTKAQQDALKANAETARLRSIIAQSTDDGLKQVAKDMGFNLDGTAARTEPNPNPGNPGFDPNKYFTRDEIVSIAEREGEAIAIAQDIAFEHRQLFPDKPLNFRELRQQARDKKVPVEQFWMDKFGVTAARDKRAADVRSADEARIRKEERDKVTAELASQYANPNTVPASSSSNVFVPRPKDGREKQPWEAGLEAENGSNDRVARAAKSWADRQAARTN